MKNKIMIAMAMILVAMVFASGCAAKPTSSNGVVSSESATESYIAMAKAKLETSSDFTSDFYGEVKMGEDGVETVSKAKVEMMKEPLRVSIVMQDSFEKDTVSSQLYLEKVSDGVNMYMVYDGQWTEMTLDENNAMKSVGVYDATKNMGLLLAAGENWEQTSLKNGIVTITGELPAQKVYDISEAGAFLQLAGMNGVDQSYYSGVEAVPFEIQVKEDGTPVAFSVDFAKTLETVMDHVLQELGQAGEDPIYVEKYYISQKFSKVGDVKKIEIPVEARDAINYEKEISLLESSAAAHQ